jgi:hypothetical protein
MPEDPAAGTRLRPRPAELAQPPLTAAIDSAYEPLGGLVELGAVGGGEGRVWVGEPGEDGAEDSPALGGFAPTPADRQRFLDRVQQFRDAPQRSARRPCSRSTSASRQPATTSTAGCLTSPSTSTATAACSSLAALVAARAARWTATSGVACAATRCTATGAGTVASTPSSRQPSAPTTAAVAALAAHQSVDEVRMQSC